jgi:hypothetical protein
MSNFSQDEHSTASFKETSASKPKQNGIESASAGIPSNLNTEPQSQVLRSFVIQFTPS